MSDLVRCRTCAGCLWESLELHTRGRWSWNHPEQSQCPWTSHTLQDCKGKLETGWTDGRIGGWKCADYSAGQVRWCWTAWSFGRLWSRSQCCTGNFHIRETRADRRSEAAHTPSGQTQEEGRKSKLNDLVWHAETHEIKQNQWQQQKLCTVFVLLVLFSGSGGRAGCLLIRRLWVRSSAALACMFKFPWL